MTGSARWKQRFQHLGQRMLRHKDIGEKDMKTELRRCLSTPQLILVGVGNTIGVGIYVLLGVMAKENAGPSVVFSFMAAIFVTMMNGLVFAEFATFVPQTGAAYVFIYKVFGEFCAFLCGWVMLISFVMSNSVGARAWSGMLDSFFNNSIQEATVDIFGNIQFGLPFAESLDIVAFIFQLVMVGVISCNILCSSIINTILGILTSSVLVFVFISGFIYGDVKNFTNEEHGGFFPFGVAGMVKATSLALYATSGFEIISLSAEECKEPAKSIPRAVVLELLTVGTVYIAAAVGMLFLIPYWLIDLRAPLPSAFEYCGVTWGKMVVTIGPIFGVTNLQMLGLYGLSRIVYRMSKDGLFFSWFLKVNKKTGVPLNSVIFVGLLTSFTALLFDLSYIVSVTVLMMLLNYMIVGSAFIKLKISVSQSQLSATTQGQSTQLDNMADKSVKHVEDFYEHEIVVSEYETCESMDSGEAETSVMGGEVSTDSCTLVDLSDSHNREGEEPGGENTDTATHVSGQHLDQNQSPNIQELTSDSEFPTQNDRLAKLSGAKKHVGLEVTSGDNQRINENHSTIDSSGEEQDGDEEDTIFQSTTRNTNNDKKHRLTSDVPNKQEVTRSSKDDTGSKKRETMRDRLAVCLSPLIPDILSVNAVLVLHWICCVCIALQVNFGWEDLVTAKLVAVLSLSLLVILLVFLSVLLGSQCRNCPTESKGFQMPLMPLVPTLSVLCSSMLLMNAGEALGFIEIVCFLSVGAVVYVLMVLVNYEMDGDTLDGRVSEQTQALIGSGEDADDEVDSDDDL